MYLFRLSMFCFLWMEKCSPLWLISSCFLPFSWIFARKWPGFLQGPQLGILCSFLSLSAWIIVISPVVVLVTWGCWLMLILGRDIVGLAVIMAGSSLLLAFYSIMLWWRTQWQSSSMYYFVSYTCVENNLFVCEEEI